MLSIVFTQVFLSGHTFSRLLKSFSVSPVSFISKYLHISFRIMLRQVVFGRPADFYQVLVKALRD